MIARKLRPRIAPAALHRRRTVRKMPTLQDITLAHSRRLSEIARDRDLRLAEARSLRDLHLRALPPAAKCLKIYDDDLLGAREKQEATDARAEAARGAALRLLIDQRADRFEEAHATRRAADTDAMQAKRRAEIGRAHV